MSKKGDCALGKCNKVQGPSCGGTTGVYAAGNVESQLAAEAGIAGTEAKDKRELKRTLFALSSGLFRWAFVVRVYSRIGNQSVCG